MSKDINVDTWKRKLAYETFSKYSAPYTGVVSKNDVTNLVEFVKEEKISFYGSMTYFILKTMNEIEEFKYGYSKSKGKEAICEFDSIAASVTTINKCNELNFTRYIEYDEDFSLFMSQFSRALLDAANDIAYYKISNLDNMNKVNITRIPWISFSNFKDAINSNEKNSKPKICWEKYNLIDNRYFIDISVLVNHAFQDGFHIGLLLNNLQEKIYTDNLFKNLAKVRKIK